MIDLSGDISSKASKDTNTYIKCDIRLEEHCVEGDKQM
jgi:hypothetical protein